MAISAIQPITNFSTLLPATSVSPPELLSVAADFVTTANARAVVTIGDAEPVSQPVFDTAGRPLTPGTTAQTTQSRALADELQAGLNTLTGLNSSTTTFININNIAVFNAQNGSASTSNLDFARLALEMNLLNAANNTGLLNSTNTADFSGVLAVEVQLALARIGTGNTNTAVIGTANGATGNNILGTPGAATTLTAPITPATVAPATVPTATVPTATVPPAIAPAATAPVAAVPAATVPTAIAPPALTVPTATGATTATTPATPATTTAAGATPTGVPTAAEALRQLVSDVTGRAVANLMDPGFASTSANLFVAAAVVRANNGTAPIGLSTADIAGNPPFEVTTVQPARPA